MAGPGLLTASIVDCDGEALLAAKELVWLDDNRPRVLIRVDCREWLIGVRWLNTQLRRLYLYKRQFLQRWVVEEDKKREESWPLVVRDQHGKITWEFLRRIIFIYNWLSCRCAVTTRMQRLHFWAEKEGRERNKAIGTMGGDKKKQVSFGGRDQYRLFSSEAEEAEDVQTHRLIGVCAEGKCAGDEFCLEKVTWYQDLAHPTRIPTHLPVAHILTPPQIICVPAL